MPLIPNAIELYRDSIELYTFASQFRDGKVNKYSLSRALRTALQHPECPWHHDAYESLVDWWLYATKEECDNTVKTIKSEAFDVRERKIDKEKWKIAFYAIWDSEEDIEEQYIEVFADPIISIVTNQKYQIRWCACYLSDQEVYSIENDEHMWYPLEQTISIAQEMQEIIFQEFDVSDIEIIIEWQIIWINSK